MKKLLLFFAFLGALNYMPAQLPVDLEESVPLWLEYDTATNQASLKWIGDNTVNNYILNEIEYDPTQLSPIDTLGATDTEYDLGTLWPGEKYGYLIKKDFNGTGVITMGLEVPAVHERGRCLIAIDDTLVAPLQIEIAQLMEDIKLDGWQVDTINIHRSVEVTTVKSMIIDWYDPDYQQSQALFILGHVAVPYSGNSAHDGHSNHQGAWSADVFYGEVDGNWTDVTVNNTTPSREENKNIPGDGKYDQTNIPTDVEIEVGRVDFHNLPAFADDEIELTRQYLNKSHAFKIGDKDYPRRGLVENNFGSFDEGFGQSGWRNFSTMFGGDSVSIQDYNTILETEKYLCSYACGGGSYTSCGGVGSTSNLWVAKDIQTIFTMTFGSYFGDWDSQNNFLRAALGSGDILTNSWAGRPVWQLYDMSLGKHIGYSTKATQNASSFIFNQGFSSNDAHIALMGDPTLRLHAVKRASDLTASFVNGDIQLNWEDSPHATNGYFIYKKENSSDWELIEEFYTSTNYVESCVAANTNYEYMVKAIRLELTGSGTYYNTSLGTTVSIQINDNPFISSFYEDLDMDGYGNINVELLACSAPAGFVDNNLDCDDSNPDINPDIIEIANNGIDEDCDGEDLIVSIRNLEDVEIKFFPNPSEGWIFVEINQPEDFDYKLFNLQGQVLKSGVLKDYLNLSNQVDGMYWIEIISSKLNQSVYKKIILSR